MTNYPHERHGQGHGTSFLILGAPVIIEMGGFRLFKFGVQINHSSYNGVPKKQFIQGHIQQQQQQPFYGPLSRTTRVSWYQKKYSVTHYPDHHAIFISFFHLPRSIASSLFKLCAWQFFAQPLSMSSLVYLLVWRPPPHIPYPISVFFSQHMPIPSEPVLLYYQYYIIHS